MTKKVEVTTIIDAANAFLANIQKSRASMTHRAYRHAILGQHGFLPMMAGTIGYEDPISRLNEKHAMQYMQSVLDLSPATRELHVTALRRFYTFIAGNDWSTVSIDRLNFLLDGSNVLTGVKRQVPFDKVKVKAFLQAVKEWDPNGSTPIRHLRNMRDRAFILTLSQSGLRVHEACKIKIKDIDFERASGIVVGKGRKQARFKIGNEALAAVQAYLTERESFVRVDPDQPVFSRHDRRLGIQRIAHMDPQTGQKIIHGLELQFAGEVTMSCHTLRHYFVTRVLEVTKNLKAAQELARHTNINVTERYAHLIDDEIDAEFNEAINA
jgi:site-specific recombinase XerD